MAIRYSVSPSAGYLTSNEVSNSEGDHNDKIRYAKTEGGLKDHKITSPFASTARDATALRGREGVLIWESHRKSEYAQRVPSQDTISIFTSQQ